MAETVAVSTGAGEPNHGYWARFFGPFDVFRDGESFAREAINRTSVSTLLKWFLINPDTAVSSSELANMLWPDRGPSVGPLHATMHHLRHALEPDLAPRTASLFVKSDRAGRYWFDPGGQWDTDLLRAPSLLDAARHQRASGDIDAATGTLEHYLQLTSATFLPEDLYSEQFQDERAAHEVAHANAQAELLSMYLQRDLCHRALSFALSVQHQDPYNEAAALTISQVHLRNGNHAAAAQQLETFIEMSTTDLGVKRDQRLVNLVQRIRSRAVTPDPPP